MSVRIINADVMDGLAQLEDESVQCCVTSPPYWGLRDYGVEGQIGLELTPEAYIEKMVAVFRDVRRVLRSDGTLWLNIGDSYATGTKADRNPTSITGDDVPASRSNRSQSVRAGTPTGLKTKDLVGIPWMLAFALRADGWHLRQEIIWAKPNPMPESVRDRCTKAHEHVFLLTKRARYYFDADAIRESSLWPDGPNSPQSIKSPHGQGFTRTARAAGNKSHKYVDQYEADDNEQHRTKAGLMKIAETAYGSRNKRSVWTIATQPYSEAHFATFPQDLPKTCIKAGSRIGDTILDPFGGAGTTGLVADKLGRGAVLIELNPEYAAIAERRIRGDCPMFTEVSQCR